MTQIHLTILYCTVCDNQSTTEERMQRISSNRFSKSTDEACIPTYLWDKMAGQLTRKDGYTFIRDYWHDWFPDLPVIRRSADA